MLIGYDNNGDGDIADAGDDVQVADVFSSNAITLTCDNNGNLTADGLLGYVYDGWNRLVEVQRSAGGDTTTVATYAYDGQNRRVSKVITNNGTSETANDGGNATVHFYYDNKWRILETRDGSNQATRQWVWGTKYVDEILFMDVNGDPTESNDCDPDAQGGESTYDRRYFYHQDRNWNVVALTEYGDGVGTDARLIERYAYTPYGQFIVLKGDSGSGELANALHVSSVGNPFTHQGLGFDHEKSGYQNRHREYVAALQRFGQRDPLLKSNAREVALLGLPVNLYLYVTANPVTASDPTGLLDYPCLCSASEHHFCPIGKLCCLLGRGSGINGCCPLFTICCKGGNCCPVGFKCCVSSAGQLGGTCCTLLQKCCKCQFDTPFGISIRMGLCIGLSQNCADMEGPGGWGTCTDGSDP